MTLASRPLNDPDDYSVERILSAGVSLESDAKLVARLWERIRDEVRRYEARLGSRAMLLCEPLMLLRFLRARENDLDEAARMFRDCAAWREKKISRALHEIGSFPLGDTEEWSWQPYERPEMAPTIRGQLGLRHGHSRKLLDIKAEDGAPVMVWRLGKLDLAGVAREDVADAISMSQVAHLEDALETCRVTSNQKGTLVRARVVVDLAGLRVSSVIANISLVKRMLGVSKQYFPEVTASVTLINAPFGFQSIWNIVSLLLNDHMRSKVKILGSGDHTEALKSHAHIHEVEKLPRAIGGAAPDSSLALCLPVPKGAGRLLKDDPSPPFLEASA